MTDTKPVSAETVPVDDVREVVEEIRGWARQYGDDVSALSDTEKTTVSSYHRCADNIESILEDDSDE